MENIPENAFRFSYDDVAEYVYNNLIDLGYVPTEDETLDMADIMYDFVLMLLPSFGVEVIIIEGMDESEEDED